MNQFDFKQYYRRGLPHVQPPEATLFVTFRLDGSIPRPVLDEWLREKKILEYKRLRREATGGPHLDPKAEEKLETSFQRRWFARFETILHANDSGPVWLKEPPVAEIVREALHHRDGNVYRLDAFSIMPNHVHAVFAPLLTEAQARQLAETAWRRRRDGPDARTASDPALREDDSNSVLAVIMQSLKGYTARKCNLALGREGAFWQHESFDRVIRDDQEFARVVNYVLNNPVKARLVGHWRDWQWNYCAPSLVEAGVVG